MLNDEEAPEPVPAEEVSPPILHKPSKDRLHGVTLEMILNRLVEEMGWEEMGYWVKIKCFTENPSVSSSLKFLRKTPWARTKVERLYLRRVRRA